MFEFIHFTCYINNLRWKGSCHVELMNARLPCWACLILYTLQPWRKGLALLWTFQQHDQFPRILFSVFYFSEITTIPESQIQWRSRCIQWSVHIFSQKGLKTVLYFIFSVLRWIVHMNCTTWKNKLRQKFILFTFI